MITNCYFEQKTVSNKFNPIILSVIRALYCHKVLFIDDFFLFFLELWYFFHHNCFYILCYALDFIFEAYHYCILMSVLLSHHITNLNCCNNFATAMITSDCIKLGKICITNAGSVVCRTYIKQTSKEGKSLLSNYIGVWESINIIYGKRHTPPTIKKDWLGRYKQSCLKKRPETLLQE